MRNQNWYWQRVWFRTIIIIWLFANDISFLFSNASPYTIESFSYQRTSFNAFFFFYSQVARKQYADTLKSYSVQCIIQTLNQFNHHWHYFFIFKYTSISNSCSELIAITYRLPSLDLLERSLIWNLYRLKENKRNSSTEGNELKSFTEK